MNVSLVNRFDYLPDQPPVLDPILIMQDIRNQVREFSWAFPVQNRYTSIRNEIDEESEVAGESCPSPKRKRRRDQLGSVLTTIFTLFLGFAIGLMYKDRKHILSSIPVSMDSRCTTPTTRLEWRSLSAPEQSEYINAARCLHTKPSRLNFANQSLHDDFAYIHYQIGSNGMSTSLSLI
jgi:hypothetical protein